MQITDFIQNHWMLVSLLIVFIVAYIIFEWRVRVKGPQRVTAPGAVRLINQSSPVIVDIRDKAKFEQGHILGAIQSKQSELEKSLKRYENKPILLVCQNGQQSGLVGSRLKKQGLTEVYALHGGMQAWTDAQLPLEKG